MCGEKFFLVLIVIALVAAGVAPAVAQEGDDSPEPVLIEFFGRSSFRITAPDGWRFVTDPYTDLPYEFPDGVEADVITISHLHSEHSAVYVVEGLPELVVDFDPVTFGMTTITGYPSLHGDYPGGGGEPNTVFVFQIGEVKIVHLGDFGAFEDETSYDALEDADVVLMPVGVTAGIPHDEVFAFMERINGRTLVPMHWFVSGEAVSGSSLERFLDRLDETDTLIEVDVLEVTPGMPQQVAVIHEWTGETE